MQIWKPKSGIHLVVIKFKEWKKNAAQIVVNVKISMLTMIGVKQIDLLKSSYVMNAEPILNPKTNIFIHERRR
jgi:hypothetical protein